MSKKPLIHTYNVNISYWEARQYFKCYDLIVIGSGIVGLNAAIAFKKNNPKSSVLVVEQGVLPSGASTKNAGFACFGSPSELLDDLAKMPENTVWETLSMRWEGLKLLKKNLGKKGLNYRCYGGYELYKDKVLFEKCADKIGYLNKKIERCIGKKKTFSVATKKTASFGFSGLSGMIESQYEAQIDTGLMMQNLLQLTRSKGIDILNNIKVENLHDNGSFVELENNLGLLKAKKVIVAVNGFARNLLQIKNVNPARAQVLITKPIADLKVRGTFHYDHGFYYFRNIDNRILLGGGRNLDIKGETTNKIDITKKIQSSLENLLKTLILPKRKFEIEHRWAGIMGVGNEKKPIIKPYTKNIICAVRMGGMGVAIGSLVGEKAAALLKK